MKDKKHKKRPYRRWRFRSLNNSRFTCAIWSCSRDRKSTRLNSSHSQNSYAVFCLKKTNAQAKTRTFDQCRDGYITANHTAWSNEKHQEQWINILTTYVTPVFGTLPVAGVDTALVC